MIDYKARIRMITTILFTIYVIFVGAIMALTETFDAGIYAAITLPAYGFIGWWYKSRDIEKSKSQGGDS